MENNLFSDNMKSDTFSFVMDEISGIIDNCDDTPGTLSDPTSAVFIRNFDQAN